MNPYQRMAWYILGVVLLSVSGFVVLYALSGMLEVSLSAFGAMGLMGFIPNVLGSRAKRVQYDEYHRMVNMRAMLAATYVCAFYFIAASLLLTFWNGVDGGDIPRAYFDAFITGEVVVGMTVYALALLALYGSEQTERITLLDRFRRMDDLRKQALLGMFVSAFVGGGFFIGFIKMKDSVPGIFLEFFIALVDLGLLAGLLGMRHSMEKLSPGGEHLARVVRAKRVSLVAMLVAGAASAAGLGLVALLPLPFEPGLYHVVLCIFYVIWIGMLTPFLALSVPHRVTSGIQEKSVSFR